MAKMSSFLKNSNFPDPVGCQQGWENLNFWVPERQIPKSQINLNI